MDFQLVRGRRMSLKKYVGRRVQVRGTVEQVSSIKQIGSSCQ
jgi:hypothetical protein